MAVQLLILNFDGADEATTFVDEAQNLDPSLNLYCAVTHDWSKFGDGSLLTDTDDSLYETTYSRLSYDLDDPIGNSDVTLHYFCKILRLPDSDFTYLCYLGGDIAWAPIYLYPDGSSHLALYDSDNNDHTQDLDFVFEIDTEYHIAFVVNNRDWYLFIDGAEEASGTFTIDYPFSEAYYISHYTHKNAAILFDAVELVKTAKWTAPFAIPTSAPEFEGVDSVSLSLSTFGPTHTVVDIETASLSLTAYAPYRYADIPAASLTLATPEADWGASKAYIPVEELTLAPRNPSAVWAFETSLMLTAKTIFRCYLTGADDGLSDLELPMASFQARMRDGEPSYLSCVIPNASAYEDDIVLRPNGDILVKKGYLLADGTEQLETIADVNFENVQIAQGGRQGTATVVGHKTRTATSPKEREVTGVSYYGLLASGKRTIRAALDLFLRPGDTVIYGTGENDSFIVGSISYFVMASPFSMRMDVTEGDI
jgi:hypothetical protein